MARVPVLDAEAISSIYNQPPNIPPSDIVITPGRPAVLRMGDIMRPLISKARRIMESNKKRPHAGVNIFSMIHYLPSFLTKKSPTASWHQKHAIPRTMSLQLLSASLYTSTSAGRRRLIDCACIPFSCLWIYRTYLSAQSQSRHDRANIKLGPSKFRSAWYPIGQPYQCIQAMG